MTYKIACCCFDNRFKNVLPRLISLDQNDFLKGRYIGNCIRVTYDIMYYLQENKSPGLIFAIDFEKALDSVSLSFIRKVLNLFIFGSSMLRWFDSFYNNASSSVFVNCFSSLIFPFERGCRQADPLSPYIFILGVQILHTIVYNDTSITTMRT